jgi:hypothetical protein
MEKQIIIKLPAKYGRYLRFLQLVHRKESIPETLCLVIRNAIMEVPSWLDEEISARMEQEDANAQSAEGA